MGPLMKEANELLAITVASIKTARKTKLNSQSEFRNPKLLLDCRGGY